MRERSISARRRHSLAATVILPAMIAAMLSASAAAQDTLFSASDLRPKSPGTAQALSAVTTLGPVAAGILWGSRGGDEHLTGPAVLIISGAIIGPSVGYFYGGCNRRGARGMLIRLGIGTVTALFVIPQTKDDISSPDWQRPVLFLMVGTISTITILTHAVADIMDVKYHVRKNNYEIIRRTGWEISLVPSYFPESGAPGIQLNVAF